MWKLFTIALVLCLVGAASAADVGNQAPVKVPSVYPVNIPNPALQGGDTIFDATVISSLPYNDAGTTTGYVNDYSSACVYDAGAPDVVYTYTPTEDGALDISLCGSTYDTGLYVFDAGLVEVACNDDFCGLQSQLTAPVMAGVQYYIVVDGYSTANGDYTITVLWHQPCILECPGGDAVAEGEPDLMDGYVDHYNGGCNSAGFPFQNLIDNNNDGALTLCGVSGWYSSPGGAQYRDTDWFILLMGPDLAIDVTLDAEQATYMFELSPQDCASVAVAQQATGGPCLEAYMTITGYAHGAAVWFWVGPTVFAPPAGDPNMYDYVASITGIEPDIATVPTSWSTVKALFE